MITINEYRPNWALNEKFAEDKVFLNVNGRLLTGIIGKELDVNQAKDIEDIPGALKSVNNYLKSKGRK